MTSVHLAIVYSGFICVSEFVHRFGFGDLELKTFIKVLFEAIFNGLIGALIAFAVCIGMIHIVDGVFVHFGIEIIKYVDAIAAIGLHCYIHNHLDI